ncbi:MAG: rod shape-determining protein MreC [Candidatus Omnitrophica bacterium]|nr:rod shape-determining protein MreC [Candidatus Omnitrophota bacterium]
MRQQKRYFFFAAFSLPLFFFLQNPQTSESIHTASLALMKPFIESGNRLTQITHDTQGSLLLFLETFRQNQFAQDEIERLQSQILRHQELEKENQRLKKLLIFRDTLSAKPVAARVIGWDPSLLRKMILLDKGTKEHVKKDMAIIVSEGLVGRVLQSAPSASRGILLTDPEARVSVVTSESRSQGVAAGDGSQKLSMLYLDLDSGVQVGEDVLTSGVGELFPKGLRIGKISAISKSLDGLHLLAQVDPYVRFSKLEEVLCLGSSRQK